MSLASTAQRRVVKTRRVSKILIDIGSAQLELQNGKATLQILGRNPMTLLFRRFRWGVEKVVCGFKTPRGSELICEGQESIERLVTIRRKTWLVVQLEHITSRSGDGERCTRDYRVTMISPPEKHGWRMSIVGDSNLKNKAPHNRTCTHTHKDLMEIRLPETFTDRYTRGPMVVRWRGLRSCIVFAARRASSFRSKQPAILKRQWSPRLRGSHADISLGRRAERFGHRLIRRQRGREMDESDAVRQGVEDYA